MNDAGRPTPATPVVPRLRLDFTYEFDDFVDAQTAYAAGGNPRRAWRSLVGWVLFIGLAVMLFMLLNQRQRGAPPRPVPAPPPAAAPATNSYVVNILLPVLPWLLIFAFIWFFVFRQLRRGGAFATPKPESMLYEPGKGPPVPKRADPEAKSSLPWVLLVLPLAAGAVALAIFFQKRGGGGAPMRILLPVIPWLVIFLALWFFLFRQKSGIKALWEAQPALHRPQVVEVYDDRIVFTDAVGRSEHAWEAFTHVRETPATFLLFTSQYSMHILPKRAFAGGADVDAFRELVRRTIAQRPAPAFPVLPAT